MARRIDTAHSTSGNQTNHLVGMPQLILLMRRRSWIMHSPGEAEDEGSTLGRSLDQIFRQVLKERSEAIGGENEVRLKADGMHGVVREISGWPLVGRNLPLVVANHSELSQPAEIFLERNDLSYSPFHRERLAGDDVGASLCAVKLPIGGHVHLCSLVLGAVEGCSGAKIVSPIS